MSDPVNDQAPDQPDSSQADLEQVDASAQTAREVIGVRRGMFGVSDAGDTSGSLGTPRAGADAPGGRR